MKHSHRWVKRLMSGLDSRVDEGTRAKILGDCGRVCISLSFINKIRAIWEKSGDLNSFIENVGEVWSHIRKENNRVYVEYDKCYCPMVKDYPEELSPSWCYCSEGWLLELFEKATGRSVKIELEKSIKQGANICRFRVLL